MAIRDELWSFLLLTGAYSNLSPGGYLEMQDVVHPITSDDGTLTPESPIGRLTSLCIAASDAAERPMYLAPKYKGYFERAGFVDVVERRFQVAPQRVAQGSILQGDWRVDEGESRQRHGRTAPRPLHPIPWMVARGGYGVLCGDPSGAERPESACIHSDVSPLRCYGCRRTVQADRAQLCGLRTEAGARD